MYIQYKYIFIPSIILFPMIKKLISYNEIQLDFPLTKNKITNCRCLLNRNLDS